MRLTKNNRSRFYGNPLQAATLTLALLAAFIPLTSCSNPQKVKGLSKNFMFGADISTLLAEESSGVRYYTTSGTEKDLCQILKESGVDLIRIRIWNDPFDSQGHSYGGGNNNLDTAIKIGQRATQAGQKVMLNFHYSDFWADPSKQMIPKAWSQMTLEEEKEALYQFTKESMHKALEAGVDVSIVQVGNETTTGMAGRRFWSETASLMQMGSQAVREEAATFQKDIQVAVHFTDPHKNKYSALAKTLMEYQVDYDIFATSYYPYWHGTLDNLYTQLSLVAETFGKKVMVAEFAYPYTWEDGDGSQNSIHTGAWGTFDTYPISTQGQQDSLRELTTALAPLGEKLVGICYWEPAWIPVPEDTLTRPQKWQQYGSGWASSWSGTYDPNDAGKYYGGCSWDNQALFDYQGHPLDSLQTFRRILGK